jgi:hypothetical protein
VAKKTGDETVKLGQAVGQKTKELSDHVGRETVKLHGNLKPHMDKLGENTDREVKKHQERARVLGENIGKSTRELSANVGAQTKVVSEVVGRESVKIATNVGNTTRQVADHVGKETVKIADHVGKESAKIADHVGKETVKIADHVGKETKKQYDKVAPIVEPHAKKYSAMVNGTMADLMTTDEDQWWKQTLDGTARAYGRVVLCDNPFTGIMICLAMLLGAPVALIISLYCAALVSQVMGAAKLSYIRHHPSLSFPSRTHRISSHVSLFFLSFSSIPVPYNVPTFRPTSPPRSSALISP